ncbi:hypothetical protein HPB52_018423 [Rhipicephalus sanguineus]|uniref:Uncharacterized protein n=1 Tax=Rhipicephalus sanguineus TaxID=34632 RepID=A0A9D4TB81_RHISA|nr:hypothetical protein HPB52_018423 [Rhipicephalus sanguineus]
MKAYKSLEAHNFFTSGWVKGLAAKELPSKRVVVLSKHESDALCSYVEKRKQRQLDFSYSKIGVWLCTENPFLAASPDALVQCTCCESNQGELVRFQVQDPLAWMYQPQLTGWTAHLA